jgi:hypothetical protein
MDQIAKGLQISSSRRLLMETLAGHIALLQENHPRKAATTVTRRAKQCVMQTLKQVARRKAA